MPFNMMLKQGFLLLLLWASHAKAAIQPADGAILNYTQVMFEFDEQEGADAYTLHLYRTGGITRQNIMGNSLACLVNEGLFFGESYNWFYTASRNGKQVFKSNVFSFSIAADFLVEGSKFRYNILQQQRGAYQDNLIFIDYLGVAIDRTGRPVWYMPWDSSRYFKAPEYRNLQITNTGTFTFLKGDKCVEKDRQGNTVWAAPDDGSISGNATEQYHHDFEKLSDGSYMACSYQYADMPCLFDSAASCHVRYNTVIHYNNNGKVLWHWNEKDHVRNEALFALSGPGVTDVAGTHMNGFSFDVKNKTAVFSFRNNNTLLWINTVTGKVLHRLRGDDSTHTSIQFTGQHSPVLLANGDLLVYNNNNVAGAKGSDSKFPKILLLSAPAAGKPVIKKWEYECKMNEYPGGWAGKEGYAAMLPNGNVLVCVGGANKVFEVTRSKKIVWEMNGSRFSSEKNSWLPFSNYRSHFASSLYPNYFTVQKITTGNTVKAGQVLRIKINNDGTDADAYKVELFSSDYFKTYKKEMVAAPGKSQLINIVLTKAGNRPFKNTGQQIVLVRISSRNNPSAVKEIEYRIVQ
jgi:hypothetical protein